MAKMSYLKNHSHGKNVAWLWFSFSQLTEIFEAYTETASYIFNQLSTHEALTMNTHTEVCRKKTIKVEKNI